MASGYKPTTAEVKRWAWQMQQADVVVATRSCCWSGLGAARFLTAFWWRVLLIGCFPSVKHNPKTQTSKLNITKLFSFHFWTILRRTKTVLSVNKPGPPGRWSLNDVQNLHIGWITQWRRCDLSYVHLHVILMMELTEGWEQQNVRHDPTFMGLKVWKHLKRLGLKRAGGLRCISLWVCGAETQMFIVFSEPSWSASPELWQLHGKWYGNKMDDRRCQDNANAAEAKHWKNTRTTFPAVFQMFSSRLKHFSRTDSTGFCVCLYLAAFASFRR